MKLVTTKKALLSALETCAESASRDPLHRLDHLTIRADGNEAWFSAADGTVSAQCLVELAEATSGHWSIAAKSLVRLVSAMPDGLVALTVEDPIVHITGNGSLRYRLECFPGDEAPSFGEFPSDLVAVSLDEIGSAINVVKHAVPTDGSRPNLSGVRIFRASGRLTVWATDGHRFAIVHRDSEGDNFNAFVPARALRMFAGLSGRESVGIKFDERNMFVDADGVRHRYSIPPLIQDMQHIALAERAEASCKHEGTCFAPQLVESVSSVLLARETVKQSDGAQIPEALLLSFGNGELGLECRRGATTVPFLSDGSSRVGLNGEYLRDAAKNHSGDVTVKFGDDLTPVVITHEDITEIVMPVRI